MDQRQLTIRLLQVYLEVIRLGSISAAARSLHLTQPTVSLQLKKLAEIIGAPLLEFRQGQLQLTDAGDELRRTSQDVLSRLDDFSLFLSDNRLGQNGTISIGIVTTAKYILPKVLGAFYKRFPAVNITLNIGNRAQIMSRFTHQLDDLYLFSHPPTGDHVQAMRILKNPLQLIAPADHWARNTKALRFNEVAQERFLLREPGSATRSVFESYLSRQGFQLAHSMQIESNETIRLSVASGLGVAVLSAHTLSQSNEALAILDVIDFPLQSHWYLVTHKTKRLPYAAVQLIKFIGEQLPNYVEAQFLVEDLQQLRQY
jgi:DNA-binding transcriptional LysR family regulator